MPKVKISEYSATANSNTDVASINIDEGCAPSGINNAIRAVMGHLKDFQQGTYGDPFNGPVNGTVGATTPSTGAFTTLSASSTVTLSGGTANGVAYLNGSKVLTTGSALVFDGTNLGVGQASPSFKIDAQVAVGGAIAVRPSTATGNALQTALRLYGSVATTSSRYAQIACYNDTAGEDANALTFSTGFGATIFERGRFSSDGNFIYTQSSLACYVWTAFNPTNTSGTTTNAPATGTGYDTGFVTMVNSSGTLTITFDIAGKYLVSTNLQTSHANTYSNERSIFTLGGTATTATGTQDPTFSGIDSVDANTTATYPIYVSATAAQTITILPTYELTGTGTTAQHTCRPSVTIQYCGG